MAACGCKVPCEKDKKGLVLLAAMQTIFCCTLRVVRTPINNKNGKVYRIPKSSYLKNNNCLAWK